MPTVKLSLFKLVYSINVKVTKVSGNLNSLITPWVGKVIFRNPVPVAYIV